jgi:Chaperone of endosialidase
VWRETQNVAIETDGRYSLLMGSTLSDGVPLDVFTSGEPRWIGITVNRPGEAEQPRVHLASVPYALKAADSDTLGGKPASAYLLAEPAVSPAMPETPAHASTSAAPLVWSATAGTPGYLGRFVDSANLGNSALYQSGASIGLGTVGPADAFHVAINNGTGTRTGYAVQNLSGAAGAYSGMLFYDQTGALAQFQGFSNATHEYRINNIASGGWINFMIGSSSKFLVANNGNIGLGTAAPQHALHVVGEGVRVQGNTTDTMPRFSLNFTGALTDEGRWQNYAAPNRLSLTALNDAENTEIFWLLVNRGLGTAISSVTFPSGNVGIGTINPSSTLEGTLGGTTLADAWTLRSSARFKSNIQTIPFALNTVLQLRGVTFDYKETQKHSIGFIAEEVGRVLPEVVESEANGRDAKGLDYNRLTPVVVEAIKEQQQEIQNQQLKSKQLQLQIESQQEQIDEQKAFIQKEHSEIDALMKRLGEIEALKALVCSQNPTAEICKREN